MCIRDRKGYEVETVSNGQDALDKCSETTYDLILLDENMPGLSGLETLSRIKEITPVTPVVMVTKSEEAVSYTHLLCVVPADCMREAGSAYRET